MITCPNCGAANRDGSLSCNQCGKALTALSAQRCHKCGTFNPPGSVTCTSCGARLTPKTVSSTPETPPAKPRKEPEAPAPPAAKPTLPPPPPSPEATGGSDDWLSRLRGALPEQLPPEEQAPDWLRGATAAPAGEPEFDLTARLRGTAEPPPTAATSAGSEQVPDWLKHIAPEPPAPVAPTPGEAEVPDWLKQLTPIPTEAKAPEPFAPPPVGAEVPDWLKQITPTPKTPQPSVPAAPPPIEAEIPEWLQQLSPAPIEAKAPEPFVPPPAEAKVPDWLQQIPPAPAEAKAPGPPAPAEAEVPDWLTQFTPAAAPTKGSEPFVSAGPPAPEPEMPGWLKGFAPAEAPSPTGAPFVGEQASALTEAPEWLKEIGGPQASAAGVVAPEAPAEMPEWLKEVEPPAKSEVAAPPVKEAPPTPGEMPTWLKEIEPTLAAAPGPSVALLAEAPAPPAPPEPAPTPVESGLAAAQLPSWLEALKPQALEPTAAPKEEEPAETEGVLEGLRGALPAANVAWQSLGAGIALHPQTTPDELARAGALQELIARGAAAPVRREGESRAHRLWGSTQRLLVFLVIAVATILPLFPGASLGLVGAPRLSAAGDRMYESIDGIKPGTLVLVAFDYDATLAPEMDTQARAVMRHLLARKARVSVVSLYPAGPAAAQVVIQDLGQSLSSTVPITITNLGYVPGQAMAIPYIIGAAPYSKVIELAATPDTLRWWVEQLPRSDPSLLWAGVSAQAEPMSQPYLASRQVGGMIVSVPDALAYEFKLGLSKPEVAPLESIAVANAALIVLIVLGGMIQLVLGGASTAGDGRRRK